MEQSSLTQYHHYIPQFILRRFAIPSSSTPAHKHGKKRPKNTKGNELVNTIDLCNMPPEINKALVKRTFGMQDMYKDTNKFKITDQMHMERKLGAIEQTASRVLARVADAHKDGKEGISLSRPDKDLLRKFSFVMKYRSPIFFRRFDHQVSEDYDSDDRTQFLAYMRAKGFRRPLDVWFDNLIKIIDSEMDPAGKWVINLSNHIYPGDATWLFMNVRSMHLVFVSSFDPSEEFILTENAFGIHEGPVSYSVDHVTGEETMTAYTEFHILNIISPHLAMLLRHNSLPEPMEVMNDELRDQKREMLAQQARLHNDPHHATSLLEDLPVAKAKNSHTVVVNGRPALAEGADGKLRASDRFHFTFFRLESRHVQTINSILLNEAHKISIIVFKSERAFRAALEFYINYPSGNKGGHSLKALGLRPDDPRSMLLVKLVAVAHLLGSDINATCEAEPATNSEEAPEFEEVVLQVLRTATPTHSNHPLSLSMTVLVEIVQRSKLTIGAIYMVDRTLQDDGQPDYPDIVFEVVQKADPKYFNQHTATLRNLGLPTWRIGWHALVKRYLEASEQIVTQDKHTMGI
jgi:hypothetical protein